MVQGTLLFLSRSTFYLVLPLLLPRTVGTLRLKYVLWNGGLALFFIVMIVTVCGALGPMAGLESFPMYTMASLAQSGPFQRLDAVYVAVWMMGLFLTLALDLYLVSVCAGRLFGKKAEKPAIPVCGVVLAVFPLLMTVEIREAAFSLAVLLMATLAIGVVFPMILLGLSKRKERKQR